MTASARETGQDDSRDGQQRRRGVFDDFSMTQVVASALAAVTSMALSSRIGVLGGVLGAAVGAGVAAIATQVWRGILQASADRMSDLVGTPSSDSPAADEYGTKVMGAEGTPSHAARDAEADAETRLMPNAGAGEPSWADEGVEASRDAEARYYSAARVRREGRRRMAATAVVIVASMAAVALTATLVGYATGGQGLGATGVAQPTTAVTSQAQDQPATTPATTDNATTGDADATDSGTSASTGSSSADSGSGTSSDASSSAATTAGSSGSSTTTDGTSDTGGSSSGTGTEPTTGSSSASGSSASSAS